MKTTTLGKTGIEVSRLAFGTWEFSSDWGHADEDAAITMIRRARDLGINYSIPHSNTGSERRSASSVRLFAATFRKTARTW